MFLPNLQRRSSSLENGDTIAKVTMALSLIADIALLAFLISSCLIRRPRHDPKAIPFKSLFVSLLSYIVSWSSFICLYAPFVFRIPSRENFVVTYILLSICSYLPIFLIANVLYRLIHAYNAQCRTGNMKPTLLSNAHGSILVILFIISVTYTIMSIILAVKETEEDFVLSINRVQLAGDILYFIASLEIMVETFIIAWKSNDLRPSSRDGIVSFAVGVFFFLLVNLSHLIPDIQNHILPRSDMIWTSFGYFPQFAPIAEAICVIGLYAGIIHCCMQWHKSGPQGPSMPFQGGLEVHMLTASNEGLH